MSFVIFKAKANIFTSLKDIVMLHVLRMCKYCFYLHNKLVAIFCFFTGLGPA